MNKVISYYSFFSQFSFKHRSSKQSFCNIFDLYIHMKIFFLEIIDILKNYNYIYLYQNHIYVYHHISNCAYTCHSIVGCLKIFTKKEKKTMKQNNDEMCELKTCNREEVRSSPLTKVFITESVWATAKAARSVGLKVRKTAYVE